jgi:hypothetical protein
MINYGGIPLSQYSDDELIQDIQKTVKTTGHNK